MSYAEKKKVQPVGVIYQFTQKEIDGLVESYVKEKTGLDLNLRVGCFDDNRHDVFVSWEIEDLDEFEDTITLEQEKKIEELGLSYQEDFMNRDNLFEAIFNTKVIGYFCYDDHETDDSYLYQITVYND